MKNLLKFIILPVFIALGSLSAQAQSVVKTKDAYVLNGIPLTENDLESIRKLVPNQNYLIVNSQTKQSYGTVAMERVVQMSKTEANKTTDGRITISCDKISIQTNKAAQEKCNEKSFIIFMAVLSNDVIGKLDKILLKYNNPINTTTR